MQVGSCRVVGKGRLDRRRCVTREETRDYIGHIVKDVVARSGLVDDCAHVAEIRPQEEDRRSGRSLRTLIWSERLPAVHQLCMLRCGRIRHHTATQRHGLLFGRRAVKWGNQKSPSADPTPCCFSKGHEYMRLS
jgi:hypothetical protein